MQKDDLENSPLKESVLNDTAKAAKAKLQAALKQFEGPRPERFAKQYKPTKEADDPLDNGYGPGDADKKQGIKKNK